MHPAARELLDALIAQDDARPRSKSGFGVSLLGGCARRAYYEITHTPKTNDTFRLSAILGTLFHGGVEALGLPGITEAELHLPHGIVGHADRINQGTVTDWKFPKLASIGYVKRYGPSKQYRWQVHTYAYGCNERGEDVHQVRIVFVPRDGHDKDIYVWEEPYDPDVAEEALTWASDIMQNAVNGLIPRPEKPEPFCRDFCPFYGELCQGVQEPSEEDQGPDPWVENAARELLEAAGERKAAEQKKYDAAAVLEGSVGRYGKYVVSWKRTAAGTYYPAVKELSEE